MLEVRNSNMNFIAANIFILQFTNTVLKFTILGQQGSNRSKWITQLHFLVSHKVTTTTTTTTTTKGKGKGKKVNFTL